MQELKAADLTCERGGRCVLSGISFAVAQGEALVLRGPNGSGKTTLLRTIAGFLPAAVGSMTYTEDGIENDARHGLGERCHYFGHSNAIKPRLTVFENVSFWQRYYGSRDDPATAEAALDAFRLLDLADYPAAHLSQGQSRRLGLARLLAAPRPLWLLDEPSASLDAASTALLEDELASHLRNGGIAVVSTHTSLRIDKIRQLDLGQDRRSGAIEIGAHAE